ncbi:MAG: hypothetical protein WBH31_17715 [Promethearchaeia archaeon]
MTKLGIDSYYDHPTRSMCDYRNREVYPKLSSLTTLQRNDAIRPKVETEAIKPPLEYITASGHGKGSYFLGNDKNYIWKKKCPLFGGSYYDPKEVENKIIHLYSCHTAKSLGPDFIKKGCKAFFGYSGRYWVIDSYKDMFFESDSEIDFAIEAGENASDVYDRAIRAYNNAIEEAIALDCFDVAEDLSDARELLTALY